MRARGLAWVPAALAAACGPGGRAADPGGDRFATEVVPVLERRCAAPTCHGVPDGVDHSVFGERFFGLPVDDRGRIAGEERVRAARESALLFVDPHAGPRFSSLVRKNLAPALGGEAHAGGNPFDRLDDPDYRALAEWVAAQPTGGEGLDPAALTALERRFAADVLPALVQRRCLTANCHGPLALLSTFRQDPGVDGGFSAAQIRANRANAVRFLHLDGPPGLSRLLLKGLPLDRGGLLHKGGNEGFFEGPDDPAVRAILAWARAEQAAALGDPPTVAGIVFARGPAVARPPFDVSRPWWGSDLFLLSPPTPEGRVTNLTAAHHGEGADVRDPAVRHDGRRIAFSMRRGPDDAWNLYEIDPDGGGLRQLTFDRPRDGFVPANVQPVYGPDGHLYFVSTRSGELGDRGRLPNTDLYELDPETGAIRRRTYGPNQEVRPAFLRRAGVAGELAFTSTRRFGETFNAPVFRFPPDLRTEYHVHFGTQRDGEMLLGLQDTPYGLHVVAVVPAGAAEAGGRLAAIDRNFGPDITDEARVPRAAMPRFEHTLTYLTGPTASDGLYRDPHALPDGRLLAARAPEVGDPAHPAAPVDYGLWLLEIGPGADGRPAVRASAPLLDAPGLADVSPVPLVPRVREPVGAHPHEDFESPTGFVNMFDLPLLQAIIETLEPRGKRLREDLRYVRILAARPPAPADMAPVDPARVRNGDPASNRLTNGVHDPVALLGTVPLGPDGSFYVEVPANVPLRFQALNEDRMAVGAQHDRWIFANPGEVLFHSTHRGVYAQRCAGCHGALDGRPESVLQPVPDAITRASVSHSTHEDADPLRPRAPVPVGLDGAAEVIDFAADIQPILDRSCAVESCHAGARPAGGLSLTGAPTTYYNDAYESLMAFGEGSGGGKAYVDERGARAIRSYLVEKILGRELEAPRPLAGPCPPPGAPVPPLSEDEKRLIARWIDLGAVFRGPSR